MTESVLQVNWLAVLAGTAAAFAAAWAWFGPLMFQKAWAYGSHGIKPPATPPWFGLAVQLAGTFLMAWVIGIAERRQALMTAVIIILAIALLQTGGSLLSQKKTPAALIDGGYVLLMGAGMIAAHAVF